MHELSTFLHLALAYALAPDSMINRRLPTMAGLTAGLVVAGFPGLRA
jgi:hypothetical protein